VGTLLILLVLSAIVAFHELGHFLFAKLFNVKVDVFSVGFGPRILSKKFGETEYRIAAIPLGGYVKMVGEELTDSLADNADPRSYTSKVWWQKFLILFAGPAFNFILGIALLFSFYLINGVPKTSNKIAEVVKESPADHAGIKPGDAIIKIDDIPVNNWRDLASKINIDQKNTEIKLEVKRGRSEQITVSVRPELTDQGPKIGVVGEKPVVVYGPREALMESYRASKEMLTLMAGGLKDLFTGKVKFKDAVSGPVGIIDFGKKTSSERGFGGILLFAALISFNLGLINLFPIPVLDGGNIVIVITEAVMRKPLNRRLRAAVQTIGIVLLLALMAFAIFNDIGRLTK